MRLWGAALACLMLASAISACTEEKKPTAAAAGSPETTPSMVTTHVETLISDSGIVRYRVTAPVWKIFDMAQEPFWSFDSGIKLEKYDDLFRQEATVSADSAIYRERMKVWELRGNVRINNIAGDKFLTELLFWDQNSQKVYSDSFIRIEQPDRTLEGYGFTSNDRLTTYAIRQVSGIFPAEALKRNATAVDSLGNPI